MTTLNYYNEIDRQAAAWLRELMKDGLIPEGEVDERSITEVRPADLVGYAQHHFFCGIGGWSRALRLAGWPEDRPVWTGSCPCQPFSTAARGVGVGFSNAKHLWPEFFRLIDSARPPRIFMEQVSSDLSWVDVVCNDMEGSGYTVRAAIIPAYLVGTDHERKRIYLACHSNDQSESGCSIDAEMAVLPWDFGFAGGMVSPHGVPRGMAYRGFGNAIVPPLAAEFIKSVESIIPGRDLDTCPYCGRVIELSPYGMGVVGVCCRGVVINRREP